jgi:hypothetical protein
MRPAQRTGDAGPLARVVSFPPGGPFLELRTEPVAPRVRGQGSRRKLAFDRGFEAERGLLNSGSL